MERPHAEDGVTGLTVDPLIPPVTGRRRPETIRAVPLRHPGRWIAALVVLLFLAGVVDTFVTAPGLQWSVVSQYLFNDRILQAAVVTLYLTAIAMVVGVGLGVLMAVMRLSPNRVMSSVSWFYIWFFRGTPVLVQLFFWWNIANILPDLSIGIPFTHIVWQTSTNALITPLVAAILGLGLNEAAYMAEIVRAGIISVDQGQTEAAHALGMRRAQVMRRIVLPQAMRVIVPPTGNETISMLKTTSLAYIVTLRELFTVQQDISNFNYHIIDLAIVASIWYLAMSSVLTVFQYYVERHFARGSVRGLPPTPMQRLRRMVFQFHARPPFESPVEPWLEPGRPHSGM
ncbi:MAG: amino acid ABC transporter permease [Candidatus Dormibacteria bacterium]